MNDGTAVHDPANLGDGWAGFDFEKAFGKPTKVINDATMQALGSYEGGRMLFLGLGTGLGSTMILEGVIAPLELRPPRHTSKDVWEDYVGEAALERIGHKRWLKAVARDDRAVHARARAGLRRPRRRKRPRARRAPTALPARAQRGRVPRRLPPLDRPGLTRRVARTQHRPDADATAG